MRIRNFAALTLAAAMCMSATGALADTITFEGRVAPSDTCEVYADVGGTALSVDVDPGETIAAGSPIVTLKTTKVYAAYDGTVSGVFAQPGDAVQDIAGRYGAVMYIEPTARYTITASTENAYNKADTKYVHIGETVYLSCYSDGDHTGEGRVTAVNGSNYTVEVYDGEFIPGETVSIFRTERHKSSSRIGRGELTRADSIAVSAASGSIVSMAVSDGDEVKRGDLLFETVEGAFDGLNATDATITAPVDGSVAAINVSAGGQVAEGMSVATIYPTGAMRIEAEVDESDLSSIAVGDAVSIELDWNRDEDVKYDGIISMISSISDAGSMDGTAKYVVYIDFTPDEDTRYGMNAVITTLDDGVSDGASDSDSTPDN